MIPNQAMLSTSWSTSCWKSAKIRENLRHLRHPRAKNGLAKRGNAVANWKGLFVACH
jgi:hypothetical protein